ncbi:MAG: PEP-CTERM sorting domain-containing protein [Reinekea sp.]
MFKKYLLVTLISILSPHILAMPMVYTFTGSKLEFSVLADLDQYDQRQPDGLVETPVWMVSYDIFFHDDIGEIYNINPESDTPNGHALLAYSTDPNSRALNLFSMSVGRDGMHARPFTFGSYIGPAGEIKVGTLMDDTVISLDDYRDEEWYKDPGTGFSMGVGTSVSSIMTLSEYYASVPEPGTLPLLFGGLMILVTVKKKNLWHKKTVFNRLSIGQRFA